MRNALIGVVTAGWREDVDQQDRPGSCKLGTIIMN